MTARKYATPDGKRVEVITVSGTSWLTAKHPNGNACSAPGNPRGWVRKPEQLRTLGIDPADLIALDAEHARELIDAAPDSQLRNFLDWVVEVSPDAAELICTFLGGES